MARRDFGPHTPCTLDKNPYVAAGAIVENKRLGAVLAVIQAAQDQRDQTRLASKKLTIRQKDRIRAAGQARPILSACACASLASETA